MCAYHLGTKLWLILEFSFLTNRKSLQALLPTLPPPQRKRKGGYTESTSVRWSGLGRPPVYDNANAQTSSKSKIRIFYFTSKEKLFYFLI